MYENFMGAVIDNEKLKMYNYLTNSNGAHLRFESAVIKCSEDEA